MIETKVNMNPSIIRDIAIETLKSMTDAFKSEDFIPTKIEIAKEIIKEYEDNKAYYESRGVDMAVVAEAENYLDQLSNKN